MESGDELAELAGVELALHFPIRNRRERGCERRPSKSVEKAVAFSGTVGAHADW